MAVWFNVLIIHYEIEMKIVHPLRPWMFLRTTCRKMVQPCVATMAMRHNFLVSPMYAHDTYARHTQLQRLRRIQQSGWLFQLWLPEEGQLWLRSRLQRKGLLFDGKTGIPLAMHPKYWEQLRKRVGNKGHGWVDGKLQL